MDWDRALLRYKEERIEQRLFDGVQQLAEVRKRLDALGPLSADGYPVWRTEIDVPEGAYFGFRWVKKRDGRVIEWAPHLYAARAGDGVLGPVGTSG
ncbi:MAG: hypothetical protein V5A20_02960 [Salinibacter sp.]|uniref:hypothetical protein n=1 Tax=Salinibacter sp. TaxID=2065818 RepID=UPI002FC347D0